MDKVALLSSLNSVIKVVAAPSLIVLGLGLEGAVTGHVLGFLVAGALGSLTALKVSTRPKHQSDIDSSFISNLMPMISYGMPLYASNLIGGFLGQYYTVILPWFTSDIEIGNYYVATVFSSIIALLVTPVSTVLLPTFSKLDPSRYASNLRDLFRYPLRCTLLLVVPGSFFVAVTSANLVAILYGPEYTQAPLYLSIYSATFLLAGFSLVLGSFFNGIGRTGTYLRAALIQLAAPASLSLMLASLYRVIGFIYGTILSALLSIAYMIRVSQREYRLEFDWARVIRILLVSALSSIPVYASTLLPCSQIVRLALAAGVFGVTYLTITPILGAIDREDLMHLRQMSKDMGLVSMLFRTVIAYEERILVVVRGQIG